MNYTEIFGEIVKIMQNDSATCKDFGAGDFEKYKSQITDDMDRMDFLHLAQDYLSTFKVYGHLRLSDNTLGAMGFSVKRYEDALYVVSASEDTDLSAGDMIVAIDSKPISEIADKEKNFFMDEINERQGEMWYDVLKFYKSVTVKGKDGSTREVALIHGSTGKKSEKYSFKKFSDETLYLKFKDFADVEAINALYEKCAEALEGCRFLIVDVRGNAGGADAAFFPLIKYAYPEGVSFSDYEKTMYPIEINFSDRNCDERLALLKRFFGDNVPEEAKPMVDKMLGELEENRGKGFVISIDNSGENIVGRKSPEKVFVITDEGCVSSGEAFVEAMAFSSRVEVVGRPTGGIIDYSNLNFVQLDDFTLAYPTSRDTRIDQGKGVGQKGVPVDHYIPWSPESIGQDPELDYILSEINGLSPQTGI